MSKHKKNRMNKLNQLMALAADTSTAILHTLGGLTPAFLGVGPEGTFTILETRRDWDDFDKVIRLECIARRATMGVFVAEFWIAPLKPGDTARAGYATSSPDRRECVMLRGELEGGCQAQWLIPIQRDGKGKFAGLGGVEVASDQLIIGRFTQLLPRQRPSEYERMQARVALAARRRSIGGADYCNN